MTPATDIVYSKNSCDTSCVTYKTVHSDISYYDILYCGIISCDMSDVTLSIMTSSLVT